MAYWTLLVTVLGAIPVALVHYLRFRALADEAGVWPDLGDTLSGPQYRSGARSPLRDILDGRRRLVPASSPHVSHWVAFQLARDISLDRIIDVPRELRRAAWRLLAARTVVYVGLGVSLLATCLQPR